MFAKEIYIERQKELLKKVDSGLILIPGNEESPMNYTDNPYRFRQDSTFLYYFGLKRPGLIGMLDVSEGETVIYGNDFTVEDFVWMGKIPPIRELSQSCGVKKTGSINELYNRISKAQKNGESLHFLPQYRHDNILKLMDMTGMSAAQVKSGVSRELILAVVSQRNYKSEEEIAEIEKGVDLTVDMHVTAMKMVEPGMSELDVVTEVERIPRAAGGDIAFPTIATINGQTLHNHYHGNKIEDGDLFLLDCGAETPECYAGDLSSTFPVGKRFTDVQKEIYSVVLNAHYASVESLKPGVPFREAHRAACLTIAEGLKGMGLMKGNIEDAVDAGAHALFFPCGTGHMMGLDIHDMENLGEEYVGYDNEPKSTQFGLKSLRLARKLEPGFVFTIEPGIYFIPELTDQWRSNGMHSEFLNYDQIRKFRDFGGIRNEENYLINGNGKRLLGSKRKPMTIDEVESLR